MWLILIFALALSSPHKTERRADSSELTAVCAAQRLGTTDGGASWSLVHDFNMPVTMVACSRVDPNTLYAAVVDTEQGGIYVSHDVQLGERSSWSLMTAPPRTVGHPWNIHALKDGSLVRTH